ncbi:MAG TPA: peptidylprolyl isomerase [Candidatus Saccharimonadales bacterium]
MKDKVKRILKKRPRSLRKKQGPEAAENAAGIPRITNETVAEHREEVLSSARKYIYPLQHSKHRVVIISISLLVAMIVAFFTYCLLALYKFQSSNTFIYRVSQIIPFPVAKASGRMVAYENYLFELRHYIHYYQTQQKVDFSSESGRQQLAEFRKRAMSRVVDYAYIKELADAKKISISDRELEDAIHLVRDQNRLGSNDQVFEDVLREFWGWSVADFKRELKQQLLSQKVVSTLDAEAHTRAAEAHQRLLNGEDFAAVAKQYSSDPATKDNGGDYGYDISPSDRNLSPQVIDTLFKMDVGETSKIVNTGSGLEILRLKLKEESRVQAAHIVITFKPVEAYIGPLKTQQKPRIFIGQ